MYVKEHLKIDGNDEDLLISSYLDSAKKYILSYTGLTEEQAKEKGLNYKSVRLPFAANGKAVVSESEEGLIKLIFDADTRKILGCHIIQEDAVELITEVVLAINNNLTLDDITKTIHSHPTLSEAISDVCNL